MALCAIVAIIVATAAYATGENVIASKKYTDDTFQTKISTDLVSLGDDWIEDLPSLVSYDETSGLVGNKYGILDYNGSYNYVDDGWNNYQEDDETNLLIPTVGAVGRELQNIWNNMPSAFSWTNTETAAVNNYSIAFDDTTNNWPIYDSGYMVTGLSLAKGLALKQNKIPSTGTAPFTDNDGSVLVTTNTAGTVDQRFIWDADGYDLASWLDIEGRPDINVLMHAIPNVGAVAVGLKYKQREIPKSGYVSVASSGLGGYNGGGTPYNTNAANVMNSWLNADVKGTGLVTRTAYDGRIGERKIFESTDVANYHTAALSQNEKDIQDISIPTVGAMMTAMQNKIPTGNVLFWDANGNGVYDAEDNDHLVPGLVAYDPTIGGLNGKKIGILDYETILDDEGRMSLYNDATYGAEMDNFVPTVRAVGNELSKKQYTIPKSGYDNTSDYTNGSPYNTNAANNKQSWLNANVKGTGLVTRTATDGLVGERKIFESTDVANYHAAALSQNEKDIQDISIPTVGAMMTALTNGTEKITWSATQTAAVNNYSTTFDGTTNNWVATDSGKLVDGNVLANAVALKQNKVPAGTSGNVVTYTGTAGVVGSNTVASAATYDQGALTNGSAIANVTLVETKQKKKVCAGWPSDVAVADRTDANCWLWYFPE